MMMMMMMMMMMIINYLSLDEAEYDPKNYKDWRVFQYKSF